MTSKLQDVLRTALGDHLVGLVLFGSRARGSAREDSDWDILLVAEDLPERSFPRHRFLIETLPPQLRSRVNLLARTPEEFEGQSSPLYLDVAAEGRIIYDPSGRIARRLENLRAWAASAGLARREDASGVQWLSEGVAPLSWMRKGA